MIKRLLCAALLAGGTLLRYGGSEFAQRIDPFSVGDGVEKKQQSNLGIVVIDMQDGFLKDEGKFGPEIEKEMPYQLAVLRAAKEKGLPIFVLEYKDNLPYYSYGKTTERIWNELEGYSRVHVLKKDGDDGFLSTDLEQRLCKEQVQQLVMMGANASACVQETARGAITRGLQILTSRQVITDSYLPEEEKKLDWYKERGESVDWYRKHGRVFDSYQDLLEVIARQ